MVCPVCVGSFLAAHAPAAAAAAAAGAWRAWAPHLLTPPSLPPAALKVDPEPSASCSCCCQEGLGRSKGAARWRARQGHCRAAARQPAAATAEQTMTRRQPCTADVTTQLSILVHPRSCCDPSTNKQPAAHAACRTRSCKLHHWVSGLRFTGTQGCRPRGAGQKAARQDGRVQPGCSSGKLHGATGHRRAAKGGPSPARQFTDGRWAASLPYAATPLPQARRAAGCCCCCPLGLPPARSQHLLPLEELRGPRRTTEGRAPVSVLGGHPTLVPYG